MRRSPFTGLLVATLFGVVGCDEPTTKLLNRPAGSEKPPNVVPPTEEKVLTKPGAFLDAGVLISVTRFEPTDAGDISDPVDAGDPIDAGDPVDAGEISDPVDAGDPIDAGDPVDAGEEIDAGAPSDPVDAGDPSDPVDAGDPSDPVDAGTPPDPVDAGTPPDPVDAGTPPDPVDAGTPPDPVDAGTPPDAGSSLPVTLPNIPDWTFYGPEQGGPNEIFGASIDEGGNLWVAGGSEGLFVMRVGETTFQRLTMADGLRPYGYMPDGTDPVGEKYLKVISVSGGPAGVAFVGYAGKPDARGDEYACEGNWDGPNPDPSIYKSGDADRVTLTPTGISVAHYDIYTGQGISSAEMRGREKVCSIYRIRYDALNGKVWFGGNHGFAMGDASYQGTAKCQWYATPNPATPTTKTDPWSNEPGHYGCNGVLEHVHPAINAYKADGTCCSYLTGGYYGLSLDPATRDVWFAGQMRTTRFRYGSTGGKYWDAQSLSEDASYVSNRIDIWPDLVAEPQYPTIADRVDDHASAAAVMPDGTLWVSSFVRGLAQLSPTGAVLKRLTTADGLSSNKVFSVEADPSDGSLWAGTSYAGISRLKNDTFTVYSYDMFDHDVTNQPIRDIQSVGKGTTRRMVVSFGGSGKKAGVVGIYSGP